MNDPIKIIHKYKNNNSRIQYQIHIFIGDILEDKIYKILQKIKEYDLYKSLISLEDKEIEIIEKKYGKYWYEFFFNSYHINNTKNIVKNNNTKIKELKEIYGDEWMKEHFINYKKRYKTITYNYEYIVKEEKERKILKKIMKRQQEESEELLDYRTLQNKTNIEGGENIENDKEEEDPYFENLDENNKIINFEEEIEKDLEDVELIYSNIEEPDKNLKLTTKEIKEVITDKLYNNISISEFNTKKDNSMFDENLKDVYFKNYITNQYIYKDDSIKTIKNKICCSFKNNNKFGENSYIIPSYQYLWSEYYYKNNIEKIMIGQKWVIKNDLLKIDVEPNNNLRIYEELRNNLKLLRDNIKRQGKIKREDDDNNILYDYQGYFTYNEIYLIDIYNEIGINYEPTVEELKNLIDVYLSIYFPKIKIDEIKNIIEILNKKTSTNKKNIENNKLKILYESINNDLILENEIMKDIELVKNKNEKDYKKIFKENYVTQSVIRVYLLDRTKKINLFRIFDNFILDSEYPFIQYQPLDGFPRYRYNEKYLLENNNKNIIAKWFEIAPYGISIKIKIFEKNENKYMVINLTDSGRIDYKIQWKEDDMSTINDIKKTYNYIRKIINKINNENDKYGIKLKIPDDEEFNFAFINTIQKFELPNNFIINHNDLSEFSRYFFPYVSLVIEPRKRQSKIKKDKNEKSKFGTYLRYKRVSKYENKTKIEHRIIFFIRNYEFDDKSLANEISKEFNITEEQAYEEIVNIRNKYPNIKKSRKVLKKLEGNIPKYKPPGIGIDIQGKTKDNYKMRIAGARNKEQLERIITFMNILIYLYMETYLYKKPERQKMKDKLKKLTKIAKRRNKVEEIVNHENIIKSVKQMTSIDKKRLNYKADEDQNQWTRNCQNSGDNKKRRPQQYLNSSDLLKMGYIWKETLDGIPFGHYEKKILLDYEGKKLKKKRKEITLRAVKLNLDDTGENFVYYTCGPDENGEHMYIGFLNKSKNPFGEPMPCCFIKDQLYSKNKEKKNFYKKSIGLDVNNNNNDKLNNIGEQLYILQDSNKIQEGRIAFLPKDLDIYLNLMINNDKIIKNHYLILTKPNYYFKYGIKQDEFKYLNAISSIFDISVDKIKENMINILEKDKNLSIFTSLNNGDIRNQFGTIESYISYIKNNEYLEYNYLNDLLSLPGIISNQGINIIIFQKKSQSIKKKLEKEKIIDNYYIVCQNNENINNFINDKYENALLIKENKNYYPIVNIIKKNENNKNYEIIKKFKYENISTNIIDRIYKYYLLNCKSEYKNLIKNEIEIYNSKEIYQILKNINNKDFIPKLQIIDSRFKCIFLITQKGYIIPTLPSGSIYEINISNNYQKYLLDYETTLKYLNEIDEITKNELNLKPIGIFYTKEIDQNYIFSSIITKNNLEVPIIENKISVNYVKKNNLIIKKRPNDTFIDNEIIKGKNNIIIDDRIYYVSKNNYENEMYQLFRYHISFFLNNTNIGTKYRKKLENIINDKKINKKEKRIEIKKLLYHMSNVNLYKKFVDLVKKKNIISKGGQSINIPLKKLINNNNDNSDLSNEDEETNELDSDNIIDLDDTDDEQTNLISNIPFEYNKNNMFDFNYIKFPKDEKEWLYILPDKNIIDYPSYIIKNNRELCYNNYQKETCENNQHCIWLPKKKLCLINMKKDLLIDFINRITEEFYQNEINANEILRKDNYFVSDIVNYNIFNERPDEKIITLGNKNLNKILSEIFGKENIPKVGKKNKIESKQNFEQLNIENPIKETYNWYIQNIINNNNTIFRAFSNSFYWINHLYDDIDIRNLGYYSILQTNLSNFYKSQVIDWLMTNISNPSIDIIKPYINNDNIMDFIIKISMTINTITNCIVEIYLLSLINKINTIIYDENFEYIFYIDISKNKIYDFRKNNDTTLFNNLDNKNLINLRFHYLSKNIYPDKIDVIYPK